MSAALQPLYPDPPADVRPLRLRVQLGITQGPGWLAAALRELGQLAGIDCRFERGPAGALPPGLGLRLYQGLERRLLGSLAPVLARQSLLPPGQFLAETEDTDELDLLLRIGCAPATPADLGRARAVLAFEPEECCPLRGQAWLLPDFRAGAEVTRFGLYLLDERAGRRLLLEPIQAASAQLLFARHRALQLQKVPALLRRMLRRLQRGEALLHSAAPKPAAMPLRSLPAQALRLGLRGLRRRWPRRGRVECWRLALRTEAPLLDPEAPSLQAAVLVDPPPGEFWADPMPWVESGRRVVYFEALDYASGRGDIRVLELDAEGRAGPPRPAIAEPWHLSYPQPFAWQGQLHLLVESTAARRIGLYRCAQFPDRFEPVAALFEGRRVVDATVHRQGSRWWLFAAVNESPFDDGDREWDALFLFSAESPLGPWQPHPANPICTDVRGARPAGPLFEHGGRLIRPGQDCSGEYGRAVIFHEVLELDPQRYRERALQRLDADWAPGQSGCHTYARHGSLEVVDGKFLAPSSQAQAR
ncbi:MAG: hypothetical protein MEQ07_09505 [Aquimonas sp.]|nr:hypothetical protein [Aquimonas sp.]